MSGEPVDDTIAHLDALVAASNDLLERVRLVAACSVAPAEVLDAAVADMNASAEAMRALGVPPGARSLDDLAGAAPAPQAAQLRHRGDALRATLRSVETESAALALELARRRSDTEEVVRVGTGSTGIYDASGRTATALRRRMRGVS